MAKSNPKKKQEKSSGRDMLSPHTGEIRHMEGTRTGGKKQLLSYGHPDRTHDGPKFRSNPKRFDKNGKKLTNMDITAQIKRTGTVNNPYN